MYTLIMILWFWFWLRNSLCLFFTGFICPSHILNGRLKNPWKVCKTMYCLELAYNCVCLRWLDDVSWPQSIKLTGCISKWLKQLRLYGNENYNGNTLVLPSCVITELCKYWVMQSEFHLRLQFYVSKTSCKQRTCRKLKRSVCTGLAVVVLV
jgi:hypothetical protein